MSFIKIKVIPDSKKDKMVRKNSDSFEVSVRAPAERGKATAAVMDLMGKELGIPPSRMRIVKGMRSRSKIIEIRE